MIQNLPSINNWKNVILISFTAFLLASAAALAGYWYATQTARPAPQTTQTPNPTVTWKTYRDIEYGFEFNYPEDTHEVEEDNEKEHNERLGSEFPETFIQDYGYSPPKQVAGIRVEDKEKVGDPFKTWVFDNPEGLTTDKWHERYVYYPFSLAAGPPIEALVISANGKGVAAKYTLWNSIHFYRFTYILIPRNWKMYLISVLGERDRETVGDQILSTFKFLTPQTIPTPTPLPNPMTDFPHNKDSWTRFTDYVIFHPEAKFSLEIPPFSKVSLNDSIDLHLSRDGEAVANLSIGIFLSEGLAGRDKDRIYKIIIDEKKTYPAGDAYKRFYQEENGTVFGSIVFTKNGVDYAAYARFIYPETQQEVIVLIERMAQSFRFEN